RLVWQSRQGLPTLSALVCSRRRTTASSVEKAPATSKKPIALSQSVDEFVRTASHTAPRPRQTMRLSIPTITGFIARSPRRYGVGPLRERGHSPTHQRRGKEKNTDSGPVELENRARLSRESEASAAYPGRAIDGRSGLGMGEQHFGKRAFTEGT